MTDIDDVSLPRPMTVEPEPTTTDVRAALAEFARYKREADELYDEYLTAKAKETDAAKKAYGLHMKLLVSDRLQSTGQDVTAYRISGRYGETVAITIDNFFEGADKTKAITVLEFED